MTQCRNCKTNGAGGCAGLWNLDFAMLSGLRRAHDSLLARGQSEITISDFLAALCSDENLATHFERIGVAPAAVKQALGPIRDRDRRADRQGGRVVLSDRLNALLLACEEGARMHGETRVSIETLFATLVRNAAADRGAGIFATHATRMQRGRTLASGVRLDDVAQTGSASTHHQTQAYVLGNAQASSHKASPYGMRGAEMPTDPRALIRLDCDPGYQNAATAAHIRAGHERGSTFGREPHVRDPRFQTTQHHVQKDRRGHDTRNEVAHLEALVREQDKRLARLEAKREKSKRNFKIRRLKGLNASRSRTSSFSSRHGNGERERDHSARDHRGQNDGRNRAPSTTRNSNEANRGSWQRLDRDSTGAGGWSRPDREHGDRTGQNRHQRPEREPREAGEREREARSSEWHRRNDSEREERTRDYTRENRDWAGRRDDRDRERETRPRNEYDRARNDRRQRDQRDGLPGAATQSRKEKKFYLALDDDIVDAPSIGPKTAARLKPLGVRRVRDLLALDVAQAADQINVRHISADVLRDWQDQARLVCTVPWLRGTHAQLLVGADYRSAQAIAEADLGEVLAAILRFATTSQGERVLRSNPPPAREKIENWIGFAKQADETRAA